LEGFFPAPAARIRVNLSDLTARLVHVTTVVGEVHPYRTEVSYALVPQGADYLPLPLMCSKDRWKSFERGNYPSPLHWDRREI